ncbi:MAG TPA: thiamine pyrophosphate-dependent enzyme [Atribacteraceae bacterium]|nr:thiamine pyrophosphate-dependent enzyme [Atribacteraceae bacterium]
MNNAFDNHAKTAWCPGCGNFGILDALKEALEQLALSPRQVVLVSGIGQAAKIPHYLNSNVFNGLHGRSLPVAFAVKSVNPGLTVIAESGDGCMYGEGGNHLLHAIRRNPDITVLVHDNQVYGLTKGQASPTSEDGFVTKTQPQGSLSKAFNPMSFAISQNTGFVARGFSGDKEGLIKILREAILWKGLSLVDILQPCVTFNTVNTFGWYKKRVYTLDGHYDSTNRIGAFEKSLEWGERIPLGVIYRHEHPTFQDKIRDTFGVDNLVYQGRDSHLVLANEWSRFR